MVSNLTAISGSTLLQIFGSNDQGLLLLDDVSVNDAQVAPVPEPASMVLLGAGRIAVAARVRRRR